LNIDIHKGVAESFSNGVTIYSYYTTKAINEEIFEDIRNYAMLMLIFPKGNATKILSTLMYNDELTGR